ncbi:14534_t:CDS:2 [Ambispora leptoticha]|uniref:14534_t:CDS:1 n=1 Tax=Ambispora leptoticha TaxID=144679 RepID=A0A9N8VES8_9GLOM|nr:14534_t:CDS:2 [Ambispora leptoticha]
MRLLSPEKLYFHNLEFGRIDTVIKVGASLSQEQIFRAQFVVLKKCDYFRAAFANSWAKKKDDLFVFEKPNITPEIFYIVLCHIYEKEIKLEELHDVERVMDVVVAADELMLPELANYAQSFLLSGYKKWVNRNLVKVLNITFVHPHIFEELARRIIHKMNRGSISLLRTAFLHKLEQQTLIAVLEREGIPNAGLAWDVIFRWAFSQVVHFEKQKYESERTSTSNSISKLPPAFIGSLRDKIAQLIKHIRFSQMSHNDFVEKVFKVRELLTKEMVNSIEGLQYYLTLAENSTILTDSVLINNLHVDIIINWIVFYRQGQKLYIQNVEASNQSSQINKTSIFKRLYRTLSQKGFKNYNKNGNEKRNSKRASVQSMRSICSGVTTTFKFNLIYRHSRDKYTLNDYRFGCHDIGPVVVIARIRDSRVLIGGYSVSHLRIFSQNQSDSAQTTTKGVSFTFTFEDFDKLETAGNHFPLTNKIDLNVVLDRAHSFDGPCFGIDDLVLDFSSSRGTFKHELESSHKRFTFDECEIYQVIELNQDL